MDFVKSISIAASGLRAQAGRMRVISENIANANSTAHDAGWRTVSAAHPDLHLRIRPRACRPTSSASARSAPIPATFRTNSSLDIRRPTRNGYVKYPNVNSLVELTDMRDAQRSYEANVNVIGATRRMIQRTLDILRG